MRRREEQGFAEHAVRDRNAQQAINGLFDATYRIAQHQTEFKRSLRVIEALRGANTARDRRSPSAWRRSA